MELCVVNSLWIGPELGKLQLLCIQSFIEKGCVFNLYTYDIIVNIPEDVVLKDANEIIDNSFVFTDIINSYATFSDWFRIKLLFDHGGWWVDSDVFCLKMFCTNDPYIFATERVKSENGLRVQICNAVLKMPKGSLIGKRILNRIDHRISQGDLNQISWTEIGARYLWDEIIVDDKIQYICDPDVFCPIDYWDYENTAIQKEVELDSYTYGIHMWNQMWGMKPQSQW